MTRRGWLLFAAMGVIWGIPYLLIKVAVSDLSPVTLVFFRTAIGALLLLPLAAGRNSLAPLLPRWKLVIAYTLAEVAFPWVLLSDAERHLTSSLTGLLIAAVPFVGVILSWLTGAANRFDARRIAGLVIGFIGVAALVGLNVSGSDLTAVGELALVSIGYAVGPLIIARRLSDVPGIGVVAVSLTLPAIAYAPFALTHLPPHMPGFQVLGAVAILGVVCTAVAFLLFFALIAETGSVRATMITYVNPAVALVLGVILLREPFTLGAALGFLLILAGLFLATRRPRPSTSVDEQREPLAEASGGRP
ncbi:MAG: DMT family transporter [Candidatus Dormibacter sp.]